MLERYQKRQQLNLGHKIIFFNTVTHCSQNWISLSRCQGIEDDDDTVGWCLLDECEIKIWLFCKHRNRNRSYFLDRILTKREREHMSLWAYVKLPFRTVRMDVIWTFVNGEKCTWCTLKTIQNVGKVTFTVCSRPLFKKVN